MALLIHELLGKDLLGLRKSEESKRLAGDGELSGWGEWWVTGG